MNKLIYFINKLIEFVFGGIVSKIINDNGDTVKEKIKKAVNDRNNSSCDTKIYQIIENALNVATGNKYKDQDKLYDVAQGILKIYNNSRGDNSDSDDYEYNTFLENFQDGICKDNDLYKRISLSLQEHDIELNQEEFQELNKKIEHSYTELSNKVDSMSEVLNGSIINNEKKVVTEDNKFQHNMKQHYIDNWNSRLFLHQENGEETLTLKKSFVEPDYKIQHFNQRIDFSNNDTLNIVMNKFMKYHRTSTMLITGVPGMGKTTIVSWIAQKYETNDNLIILRFRDWDSKDLDSGLLKAICNTLECKKKDLNEKLLVLDGFDEMKLLDKREHILSEFLNGIKDLEKSKIIITSRPTYITTANFHNRVELLPFSVKKVQMFYREITGTEISENKVDKSNLDVIGIPVILYMAIMSNIDITKSSTKPKLYNSIFAEEGGIFDRFSEYDSGSQIMRNSDNIKKYLKFLQDVAFMMFEKNDSFLLKNECIIPELEFEGKNVSILEFPIKHLFENTEGGIEFIHNSIYEYFVSEYILESISEIIKKDNFKIEDLAGVMGRLFKYRRLSSEIIEFLKYRVRNGLNDKFGIVNDAFNLMLQDGMTYYTYEHYKNIIDCEWSVFVNMLEVLHLWEKDRFRFKLGQKISYYIKHNIIGGELNLRKINLVRADLRGADLRKTILNEADLEETMLNGADLRGTNLTRTNLTGANLTRVALRGADLRGANLRGANLAGADLAGADLNATIFDEEQIVDLRKQDYNLQNIRVYIEETEEIISYEEYCERKH